MLRTEEDWDNLAETLLEHIQGEYHGFKLKREAIETFTVHELFELHRWLHRKRSMKIAHGYYYTKAKRRGTN